MSEPSSTRQYKEQPCLTFEERLQQCPGGPWTIASASTTQTPDTQVVRLHKVIPGRGWCEEATYVDFLDQRIHRQLLDCFVLNTQKLQWPIDELLKQIGPRISRMTLETALLFCEAQGFIVAVKNRTWWSRGPQLSQVQNLGATFEWLVQEFLQRRFRAVARRCVILKELPSSQFGDFDILAFTEDGLTITIECKSSTSGITNGHLTRFLKRSSAFPADIALLLIDTDETNALLNRLPQINAILDHEWKHRYTAKYTNGERVLYHLQDNLYLSNTAGGISAALEDVLVSQTKLMRQNKKRP